LAYTDTQICNLALAELPDKPIASLDETSLQARECKRVYQQAVLELFEAHPWQFGTARIALAQITNDRAAEWLFAYAMPSNIAMLRKIIVSMVVPDTSYLTYGQRPAPIGANIFDRAPAMPFLVSGSTIYTDIENAVAEYLPNGAEASFTPLFVKALYFDIASRICTPLTKSADKKKELIGQAELWMARAKANDLNSQQNTYDAIPDVLGSFVF
jgi:hypothetical protein